MFITIGSSVYYVSRWDVDTKAEASDDVDLGSIRGGR